MINLSFSRLSGIDGLYRTNIPLANTAVCLYHLFQKCVIQPRLREENIDHHHYYTHLTYLNPYRELVLAIPLFGMLIIGVYDLYAYRKGTEYYHSAIAESEPSKKIELFTRAAEWGLLPAIYSLGIYLNSEGPQKDETEAFKLLELAAIYGHSEAQLFLGQCYLHENCGVSKNLDKAISYLEKAIAQKNMNAMLKLAAAYLKGSFGLSKDLHQALSLYESAANEKCLPAIFTLGKLHSEGTEGVSLNPAKAIDYFKRSMDFGVYPAAICLGHMYLEGGTGLVLNNEKALYYYREAIKIAPEPKKADVKEQLRQIIFHMQQNAINVEHDVIAMPALDEPDLFGIQDPDNL